MSYLFSGLTLSFVNSADRNQKSTFVSARWSGVSCCIARPTPDTRWSWEDWVIEKSFARFSGLDRRVLPLGNPVQKMSSSCEWNAVKLRVLLTKTRLHIAIAIISCTHYKLCRRVSSEYHGVDSTCVKSTLVCTYAYEQFSRAHLMGWLMIHWRLAQGLSDSIRFTNDCHLSIMSLLPSWQEWLQLRSFPKIKRNIWNLIRDKTGCNLSAIRGNVFFFFFFSPPFSLLNSLRVDANADVTNSTTTTIMTTRYITWHHAKTHSTDKSHHTNMS